MRASRRVLVVALAFLSSLVAAQQSDQVIAERVLGPKWKQLSRRAGMIFAGTVLTAAAQTVTNQTAATDRLAPGTTPAVQLSFHVDEAIAGVERGQVLTIHEWAGAWSMHRPMSKGQHFLIFFCTIFRALPAKAEAVLESFDGRFYTFEVSAHRRQRGYRARHHQAGHRQQSRFERRSSASSRRKALEPRPGATPAENCLRCHVEEGGRRDVGPA